MATEIGEWEAVSSSSIKVTSNNGNYLYGQMGENSYGLKTLTVRGIVYTEFGRSPY